MEDRRDASKAFIILLLCSKLSSAVVMSSSIQVWLSTGPETFSVTVMRLHHNNNIGVNISCKHNISRQD